MSHLPPPNQQSQKDPEKYPAEYFRFGKDVNTLRWDVMGSFRHVVL